MIQNKYLTDSPNPLTRRSSPINNFLSEDQTQIINSSIVYITFKKKDKTEKHVLTGSQTISPVGELSLHVTTSHLYKLGDDQDQIDEMTLFQIRKVNSANQQLLKYKERFYLIHKYSGLYLVCKQNTDEMSFQELGKEVDEMAMFYCEAVNEELGMCQLFVSPEYNVKICNSYLKNKYLRVISEHNIHKNLITFCEEHSLFTINVYRTDDSILTLDKASYLQIHQKKDQKKLKIMPTITMRDFDLTQSFTKYSKPQNFQITLDDSYATVWKVQSRKKKSHYKNPDIVNGDEVSFKCASTGLYLSCEGSHPNNLHLKAKTVSKRPPLFKINKLVDKFSQNADQNKDETIWFDSPIQMFGNQFVFKKVRKVLRESYFFNCQFESAFQSFEYLKKVYSSSNNKPLQQISENAARDQIFASMKYVFVFQQLYERITSQIGLQADKQLMFIRSMIFLGSLSKICISSNDKKAQEHILGNTLQNQIGTLTLKILKYVCVCIPYLSSKMYDKQAFYTTITTFLSSHKYMVQLVLLKAQKYSPRGGTFSFISKRMNFKEKNASQIVKIMRKLHGNQNHRKILFTCKQNVGIEFQIQDDTKLFVNLKCNDLIVYSGQVDSRTDSSILNYVLFGIQANKISIDELDSLVLVLKNIYLDQSSSTQLKIFIVSVFNSYFLTTIPQQSVPICLKYGHLSLDSKAHQMFIYSPPEGLLQKYTLVMDPVIDSTILMFGKKSVRYKIKIVVEYVELMKKSLKLIQYYTILGIYTIIRLISVTEFVLQCCFLISSCQQQESLKKSSTVKEQYKTYIEHQIKEIECILTRIIEKQAQLINSWILQSSQVNKLSQNLSFIKIKSLKLLGVIENKNLFTSIKHLSMARTDYQPKYTIIKQKNFRKKEYAKIQIVKETANELFQLFKKLEYTLDQSSIKIKIQEELLAINTIIKDLNQQLKMKKFQLFYMQNVIKQNGVYKELSELILSQTKVVVNFDWKSIITFLCNFIIGNPTNARLLLPYRFQQLLIGDELDILLTEMFIYAESPLQISRLEKRLSLSSDIRHKIKYFRILLTLSNKIGQQKAQSTLNNKIVIFKMLLRIDGFLTLVKQFPDGYRLGTKNPRSYDSFNQYSLQIHKVLVYLICQVSKNTPLSSFEIQKWFPIQQIAEICVKPSELYWDILKPYLYVLNNSLNQLNLTTLESVSLNVLKNFSSQLHKTIKNLTVYDDVSTKLHVWTILQQEFFYFQSHFPSKNTANALGLFPRKDEHFWKLFYAVQEDCIKFGLLIYIVSLLQYHTQMTSLSSQLIDEISKLNVLFQGLLWVFQQIQRVKEELNLNVSFTLISKHLSYAISMLQQINPTNLLHFQRQQIIRQQCFVEDYHAEHSATSLAPLVRQETKARSNITVNQPTRQQIRKIIKHQTQIHLAEPPIQLIQHRTGTIKLCSITAPTQYNWNNFIFYLDLLTISDLHFLHELISTFSPYFQSNYSNNVEIFLFQLSERLKSEEVFEQTEQFYGYFALKLKILKQILEIVFKHKNIQYLQKDFLSFSLMIRNTFDFMIKSNCQWRILVEVTSICTIYLSCLKDPISEIRLLEQIFNNSNNQLERRQLMTKLFSTSMDLQGYSAFELLSHPKLSQTHYIPVIQMCLRQELSLKNPELPVVYSMLEVVLNFNLFVTQKFQTNLFDSQYFSLLCTLKNKIVKQRLMDNISHLTEFKQFSCQYSQFMSENQFSVYLLLILITIENICQMIIPSNQKYLFNSTTDCFHQFYSQHLAEVEIVYKGRNIIVCYPKFFNQRNVEIKDSAINIIKQEERVPFNIIMKAAQMIQQEGIQLCKNSEVVVFLKGKRQYINGFSIVCILIATLYLLIYKSSNLSRHQFDPVSFVFLLVSFMINILNCVFGCMDYYQQNSFKKKIAQQTSQTHQKLQNVLYYSFLVLFSMVCFVQKYLISFLMLILLSQKFGLKIHDNLFSPHTKKLIFLALAVLSLYIIFLQFHNFSYSGPTRFSESVLEQFFSIQILPPSTSSWNVLKDLIFQILTSIYIPAVIMSFLIIYKISEMNTSSLFKCLVCQKIFNHASFSKHQIHKLSNYISYYSFILERKYPLNKLEEYVRMHIASNDIGIFPE